MRYAQIRSMDISNGEGIGMSLFTQGCPIHCPGCFNQETWDFFGGKTWTNEVEDKFIKLVKRPFIKRISVLGGEPLIDRNIRHLERLFTRIKEERSDVKIWLYTGYEIDHAISIVQKSFPYIDFIVCGPYVEEKRDLTLKFRGSSNQKIISKEKFDMNMSEKPKKTEEKHNCEECVFEFSQKYCDSPGEPEKCEMFCPCYN